MARVQIASQANKQISLPHTNYNDEPVSASPVRFDQNGWAYIVEAVWEVNKDGKNERSLVRRDPTSAEATALQELYNLHGVVVFDDEAADEAEEDESEEDE